MQWYGLRIPVILLALLIGLGLFFGVRWLYHKFSFEEPLTNVLQRSEAVQSFEIVRTRPVTRIIIHLAPTGNLKETYQELNREIRSVLGKQPLEIKLVDRRDEKLAKAFYYSQFAIYEAIQRGNYREMLKVIEDQAAKIGATATVFLDRENIYVQMQDNGHYLYEIISRREPRFPVPGEEIPT